MTALAPEKLLAALLSVNFEFYPVHRSQHIKNEPGIILNFFRTCHFNLKTDLKDFCDGNTKNLPASLLQHSVLLASFQGDLEALFGSHYNQIAEGAALDSCYTVAQVELQDAADGRLLRLCRSIVLLEASHRGEE